MWPRSVKMRTVAVQPSAMLHEEIGDDAVQDEPPRLFLQAVAFLEASLRLVLQHADHKVDAEDGE